MPLCTCLTLTCTHKFISIGLRMVSPCRWRSWRSKALLTAPCCLASPLSLWKPPWSWATSSASSRWAWPAWLHGAGAPTVTLNESKCSPVASGFVWSEWGWDLQWFPSLLPPPKSSQHFGVWVFSESELSAFNGLWQKVHVGGVQLLKALWI